MIFMGNWDYKENVESANNAENKENANTEENKENAEKTGKSGNAGSGENVGNTGDISNMENVIYKKKKRRARSVVRRKTLTGSFVAKVVAFFLLTMCTFGAVASGITAVYLASEGYYSSDMIDIFMNESYGVRTQNVLEVREAIAAGNLDGARAICSRGNMDIALLKGDLNGDNGSATDNPAIIWTTYNGDYEIGAIMDYNLQFSAESLTGDRIVNYTKLYARKDYVFRVYINPDFPEKDQLAEIYHVCRTIYGMRYIVLWILGISVFLGLNSFLFLMCSAGHRNDAEGIQPSVFSSIPLDLYTAFYGIAAAFLLIVMVNMSYYVYDSIAETVIFAAAVAVEALWCTFYLRELAVRMKLGFWWRNTVIYRLLKFMKRTLRFCGKGIIGIFRLLGKMPLVFNAVIILLGVSILEVIVTGIFCTLTGAGFGALCILWLLKKFALVPVVIYFALMCRRLLEGSRAIAEGRQEAYVDTSRMFWGFRECGENLNNIGRGISKAVAERMKSEHLKTELITNVTHDIKTPLTSIINYANLIADEPTENEKIAEYSEVLVRQSGRLKKLLEDLLEASKATTGNLEVNLQPCEVSVILSQAMGEYQQRMDEKQLELIVTQPEQPVNIMADGRHLWRVFDNLLNNICKYAREDSRVYLSVEVVEKNVSIIFRNMSKYALNITPEELQERFVRGDRSRHMEGNGLGLSIAKSLTELQNGRMEIVTDGDLFKVSLLFEMM